MIATDVSAAALAVAQDNAERLGVADRIEFRPGSWWDAVGGATELDFVVSNPPYVDHKDMGVLASEFRHEPELGLAAGAEGLDSVIMILHDALGFLDDNGLLIVEVGNSQAALEARFASVPFVWLEFAQGGAGVFLLTKQDLQRHQDDFQVGIG